MSTNRPLDLHKDDPRRTAEASEWLVRLREEPTDESTVNAWLRWCEADSANVAAFERVQTLWRQMDHVVPDQGSAQPSSQRAVRRRYVPAIAVAAGLAAVSLALWQFFPQQHNPPQQTATREHRTSVLPDGSAVELGARTSVAVDFGGAERLLQLSLGEAYFKVQPDPQRPFKVRAGSLEIIAVGTAFDINHQPQRTTVTVQEGIVAVQPLQRVRGTAAEPWRVASGYQFVYSQAEGTATLSSVDTSAVLAWREGRLEYTRTPLSAVLADINRYAQQPIELADTEVGELTFTGTVFTDSISGWIGALPGALPVDIERTASGKVLLSKRAPPAADEAAEQ